MTEIEKIKQAFKNGRTIFRRKTVEVLLNRIAELEQAQHGEVVKLLGEDDYKEYMRLLNEHQIALQLDLSGGKP